MLLILHSAQYRRPPNFFFLTVIAIFFVAIQISIMNNTKNKRFMIILLQIFILSAFLRFSIQPLYNLETNSDAWFHSYIIKYIIMNGNITSDTLSSYGDYPIYHLLVAMGQLISQISPHYIVQVFIGIPFLLSGLFIFLGPFNKGKIGGRFIAMFFFLFSPILTFFGWVLTPVSLGFIYVLSVIYLLLGHSKSTCINFLLILLGIECILTNIVSSSFLGLSLIALSLGGYLVAILLNKKVHNFIKYIIFFWIFDLAYMIYISRTYKFFVINAFKTTIAESAIGQPLQNNSYLQFLSASWFFVIEFAAILGILGSMNKKITTNYAIIGAAGASLSAIAILIFDLGGIATAIPYRWFLLLTLFVSLCIPVAIDLMHQFFDEYFYNKETKKLLAIFSLSILAIPFIFSPLTSFDNPLASSYVPSTAFKDSEILGASFLSDNFDKSNRIVSDYYYLHLISPKMLNVEAIKILSNGIELPGSILLLRREILEYPYYAVDVRKNPIITNFKLNMNSYGKYNEIYNSSEVKIVAGVAL